MQNHSLDSNCTLTSGTLASSLRWSEEIFESIWSLHPLDYHDVWMINRFVKTPRWQQAYGATYDYTGSRNDALPIPMFLNHLLLAAQRAIDQRLNGILLNWYQGCAHYIGEHHDSIKGLVNGAPIVTISFGESRTFRLTKGKKADRQRIDFLAEDGSVFVMPWDTNKQWKHSVPKSQRYSGRRISVTLRAFEDGLLPEGQYFADDCQPVEQSQGLFQSEESDL